MTSVMTLRETVSRAAWQKKYARRLVVSDTVVVFGAIALAHYIRFGRVAAIDQFTNRYLVLFSTSFAIIWLAALTILRTRSPRVLGSSPEEYRGILSATFWTFGLIAIVSLITQTGVARGYLVIALPAGCIGLLVSRCLWRRELSSGRAKGYFQTSVVAIGSADAALTVAHELMRDARAGYHVVGIGIPGYGPGRGETVTIHGNEVPILGDEICALDQVKDIGADTVAVTGTDHFGVRGIRELMWRWRRWTSNSWSRRVSWTSPVRGCPCGRWPGSRSSRSRSRSIRVRSACKSGSSTSALRLPR